MRVSTAITVLAAAAGALARVVPTSVDTIDVTASTVDTLTLSVTASLTAEASDAGRAIPFTFGSADGTFTFGSGVFNIPAEVPASGALTVSSTASWNPTDAAAKAAGEAVLSAYSANRDSAISVSGEDGVFLNVPLKAPGVEIIQRLFLVVDAGVVFTQQSNLQIQIRNEFSVPLTFTGLVSNATAPVGTTPNLLLGTITQNPLPTQIVIPGKSVVRTGNIQARSVFTLTQALALLNALSGGRTITATTNSVAQIKLGDYATTVSIFNKQVPAQAA